MIQNLISEQELQKIEKLLEKDIIGVRDERDEETNEMLESTLDIDDISDRLIIISAKSLAENYREAKWQIWRATGGFGCQKGKIGGAVFAKCIEDGEEARWRINDVIAVIK